MEKLSRYERRRSNRIADNANAFLRALMLKWSKALDLNSGDFDNEEMQQLFKQLDTEWRDYCKRKRLDGVWTEFSKLVIKHQQQLNQIKNERDVKPTEGGDRGIRDNVPGNELELQVRSGGVREDAGGGSSDVGISGVGGAEVHHEAQEKGSFQVQGKGH